MNDTVINDAARHRFELAISGHLAVSHYRLEGDIITFEHTEVPTELEGQGVGSRLVKGALDQVRGKGWRVVARCPFVQAYINKHAEYRDLLKA